MGDKYFESLRKGNRVGLDCENHVAIMLRHVTYKNYKQTSRTNTVFFRTSDLSNFADANIFYKIQNKSFTFFVKI